MASHKVILNEEIVPSAIPTMKKPIAHRFTKDAIVKEAQ